MMRAILGLLLLAGLLLLSGLAMSGKPPKVSVEVQQFCDDFFQWRLSDRPEYGTFVGYHDHNDRLDDLSMEAFEQRLANVTLFLERLEQLEPTLVLHEDHVNMQVMRDTLETYRDGYPFKSFYFTLNNMEGVHIDFLRLLSWMPQSTLADYNTMLTRLQQLPREIEQTIELMTRGVQSDITFHERSLRKVIPVLDTFLVPTPEESPIYQQSFTSFPEDFTAEEVASVQKQAASIIAEQITPAFQQLKDYLTSGEYRTRPSIAITSLPNGNAHYAQCIKFCTGGDMLPEEIQQLGYSEVERIEVLMQEIVYEMGHNMTVQEFSAMIRNDPKNYFDTEEELLEAFQHVVYNVTTPALPLIFKNIPKTPIQVDTDPKGTGAYYMSSSFDGSRPGVFYVGTEDLKSQAKYSMLTLSLHEGNPGHHLQGSHAIESPDLLYFRSSADDRNYAQAPSKFPVHSYYVEGWGLYSENCGFDMGLYSDLLELYGHYSYEIFRACRLVVDTGIHALGMTREEAMDYLLAHTALGKVDIENEVDRYITWPGQALSYKTGQLKLSGFRTKAEKQLGDDFNIKDFHDVVLESVGPMSVVEEEVDRWIKSILDD